MYEAHPFEKALSVMAEDSEMELSGQESLPWDEFFLNPRHLRGSDFLMRWSQGRWSEERMTQAINSTGGYFALPYGPSGVAPNGDVRDFEIYMERLEAAGLGHMKRPDLLIFRKQDQQNVQYIIDQLGGLEELPFIVEEDDDMQDLLTHAIIAVECENSLWKARQMPDFGKSLTAQKRLGGSPGLKKNAVVPTIIVKNEDREPLLRWQNERGLSIHVWHAFYDDAYGIALDYAESLVEQGLIEPTAQVFQAPNGTSSEKTIYKFYYHYAYPLCVAETEPTLEAAHIVDKNGRIMPYVKFVGGSLRIMPEAIAVLDQASASRLR
jgi:hypothetical protein